MKLQYRWAFEITVLEVKGKDVVFKARYKQMNDEWDIWQEMDSKTIEEGATLTYDFPFTFCPPDGAKVTY